MTVDAMGEIPSLMEENKKENDGSIMQIYMHGAHGTLVGRLLAWLRFVAAQRIARRRALRV